jgi:Dolichyl-phosphate-mannose-protein mannosyltransferase
VNAVAVGRRRPWALSLETAASADAVALAALAVLVAGLVAFTWGTWGDLGADTGYDLVAGARVAHGHLPYVSFVYYYGPLAPFLLGLAALLGGGGLGPAVALGLVLACGIVFATYVLARLHAGVVGGFLAGAITAPVAFAPTNFSFVMPHTYSESTGLLCVLAFLIGLTRYAQTSRAGWLVSAGVAAGLCALTRPEFELAVLLAAALWLVLRMRSHVSRRLELAVFAAPALAIPAAIYGSFLAWVPFHPLVFDNLYPVGALRAGPNNVYKAYAPLSVSSFASIGAKLGLYVIGTVCLLAAARALRPRSSHRRVALFVVGVFAVVLVAGAVARPETLRYYLRFAYGWIPAGVAIVLLVVLWRFRRRDANWSAAAQAELAGLTVLFVLAAKVYGDFLPYAHVPQLAVYVVPFAAVFLARLHLVALAPSRAALALGAAWLVFLAAAGAGLTIKDARAESAWVHGPGGSIRATPADARIYQQAIRWLVSGAPRGQPVLTAPQLTSLYVLADRPNPLPQISLLPGSLTKDGSTHAAIVRLAQTHVAVIITDRRRYTEYDQTYFGGSFDRGLARWIRRHYRRDATLTAAGWGDRSLDVWIRRRG